MGNPAVSEPERGGRPSHRPSQATRSRVNLLLALAWSNQRIASALGLDLKTLKKHYADELRLRASAADRLNTLTMSRLLDLFLTKNSIPAARELRCCFERADRLRGQTAPTAKPGGKKQRALELAQQLDPSSPMDQILIRRKWRADRPRPMASRRIEEPNIDAAPNSSFEPESSAR